MIKKIPCFLSVALLFLSSIVNAQPGQKVQNVIDLSGEWRFQIDSLDKGIEQQWFNRKLADAIKLPGSMTTKSVVEGPKDRNKVKS